MDELVVTIPHGFYTDRRLAKLAEERYMAAQKDELVRRLREVGECGCVSNEAGAIVKQAADAITTLTADLAVWKCTAENLSAQNVALRELAVASEGKQSTLMAALEGLVAAANDNMGSDCRFDDALDAARAALREVGRG